MAHPAIHLILNVHIGGLDIVKRDVIYPKGYCSKAVWTHVAAQAFL